MQTKNINIKFPQAKAGAEERLRFYPTMHFFNCDSLVLGSNAEIFWFKYSANCCSFRGQ